MLILAPTKFELETLFGPLPDLGSGTVEIEGGKAPDGESTRVGLSGFGLAAAGLTTLEHLRREKPQHALLVGIAGAFDLDSHPHGSVHRVGQAHCHGIGAGEGEKHLSAERLGFASFPDGTAITISGATPPPPLDRLPVASLLSVTSAAGSPRDAAWRASAYPDVVLEDMEGWSFLHAGRLAGVRVSVVRAVSNAVGDRETGSWKLAEAFDGLRSALAPWISR